MFCRACAYDLSGLAEASSTPVKAACPECGRAFDPADHDTFSTGQDRPIRWLVIGWSASVYLLLLVTAPVLQWSFVRFVQGMRPDPTNHPGPLGFYVTPFVLVSIITGAPIWAMLLLMLAGWRERDRASPIHSLCWVGLLVATGVVLVVGTFDGIYGWWWD